MILKVTILLSFFDISIQSKSINLCRISNFKMAWGLLKWHIINNLHIHNCSPSLLKRELTFPKLAFKAHFIIQEADKKGEGSKQKEEFIKFDTMKKLSVHSRLSKFQWFNVTISTILSQSIKMGNLPNICRIKSKNFYVRHWKISKGQSFLPPPICSK